MTWAFTGKLGVCPECGKQLTPMIFHIDRNRVTINSVCETEGCEGQGGHEEFNYSREEPVNEVYIQIDSYPDSEEFKFTNLPEIGLQKLRQLCLELGGKQTS